MKYKEGDKVRIKAKNYFCSVDGFNNINMKDEFFNEYSRLPYCETVMTIGIVNKDFYILKEDRWAYKWTDEMIEGLVEESDDFEKMYMESEKRYEEEYSKGEYCHEQSFKWGFQEGCDYAHENEKLEINLKNGYQFVDENGNVINATKIVLEKKKTEYPKTYEECIGKLPINWDGKVKGYKSDLLTTFQKLLICRDVYWKIAGDEMGLGKPWEPDYSEESYEQGCPIKYVIYYTGTHITKERKCTPSYVLSFPTAEMRDAFYVNFKEEIEFCKELL